MRLLHDPLSGRRSPNITAQNLRPPSTADTWYPGGISPFHQRRRQRTMVRLHQMQSTLAPNPSVACPLVRSAVKLKT